MAILLITPPASEPVTLQEAKDHLRVDVTEDDSLIENLLIPSARQSVETYLRRSLLEQTWELSLDCFDGDIKLPNPPLQSVTSIKYIDVYGVEQTLAASEYTVHTQNEPGLITLAYDKSWPSIRAVKNAVKVRYVTGYADADSVPAPIKSAMLLLIGHLYENREQEVIGQSVESLLFGYKQLLFPYRIIEF